MIHVQGAQPKGKVECDEGGGYFGAGIILVEVTTPKLLRKKARNRPIVSYVSMTYVSMRDYYTFIFEVHI